MTHGHASLLANLTQFIGFGVVTSCSLPHQLKNAYAIAKLRKATGYSKNKFYEESVQLYKQINILMAVGDKTSLRKAVTENMYSTLKNEIKQRESSWSSVYWELVEPIVKIRTLRARMKPPLSLIGNFGHASLENVVESFFGILSSKISFVLQIGIDKNDLKKAFIQLTIEFLSKQKFEAYDSKGNVVAGDKTKEVRFLYSL
ncbi:hypothetical protein ACLOJK_025897 [Asimina triloba]